VIFLSALTAQVNFWGQDLTGKMTNQALE